MESVTKTAERIIVTHGYARCSTDESKQDIDRQVRELKAAGATKIWMEYEHGDSPTKEQQDMMWDTVRPGDTVIITEPLQIVPLGAAVLPDRRDDQGEAHPTPYPG